MSKLSHGQMTQAYQGAQSCFFVQPWGHLTNGRQQLIAPFLVCPPVLYTTKVSGLGVWAVPALGAWFASF